MREVVRRAERVIGAFWIRAVKFRVRGKEVMERAREVWASKAAIAEEGRWKERA